jgi:hypothetical protein
MVWCCVVGNIQKVEKFLRKFFWLILWYHRCEFGLVFWICKICFWKHILLLLQPFLFGTVAVTTNLANVSGMGALVVPADHGANQICMNYDIGEIQYVVIVLISRTCAVGILGKFAHVYEHMTRHWAVIWWRERDVSFLSRIVSPRKCLWSSQLTSLYFPMAKVLFGYIGILLNGAITICVYLLRKLGDEGHVFVQFFGESSWPWAQV